MYLITPKSLERSLCFMVLVMISPTAVYKPYPPFTRNPTRWALRLNDRVKDILPGIIAVCSNLGRSQRERLMS